MQSNYIPWRGYFDLINYADVFVFYDEVQYTKNDWRNRNQIKTSKGKAWLTIPVGIDLKRKISEVEFAGMAWKRKHKAALHHNYSRAPFFDEQRKLLDSIYDGTDERLSQLNQRIIKEIAGRLGIATEFRDSAEFECYGDRVEKLVNIVKACGGSSYVSGPAGKNYLDEAKFSDAGVKLEYFDYSGYPDYPQLHGAFEPQVSILDLMFNVGADAPKYMKTF